MGLLRPRAEAPPPRRRRRTDTRTIRTPRSARSSASGRYPDAVSAAIERLNRPLVAVLAVAAIAGVIRFAAIDDPPSSSSTSCTTRRPAASRSPATPTASAASSPTTRSTGATTSGTSARAPSAQGKLDRARHRRVQHGCLRMAVHVGPHRHRRGGGRGLDRAGALRPCSVDVRHRPVDRRRRPERRALPIALLDVHVVFWVALGFLLLALDRRWIDRRTPPEPEPPSEPKRRPRPTRPWATGFRPRPSAVAVRGRCCAGAAAAVKWSGAMAIPAAVLLTYIWETTRRHRGRPRAPGRSCARSPSSRSASSSRACRSPSTRSRGSRGSCTTTRACPPGSTSTATCGLSPGPASHRARPEHRHVHADARLLPRPGRGSRCSGRSATSEDLGPDIRQILAIGNPVLFWGTMWTIPYCAWAWWRKRDWIPGFIVVAFAGLYLPWFLVARPQFFFYALPLTPFMALAAVYTMRDLAAAHLVIRDHETGGRDRSGHRRARGVEAEAVPALRVGLLRRGRRIAPVDVAHLHREPHHRHDVAGSGLVPRLDLTPGRVAGRRRRRRAPSHRYARRHDDEGARLHRDGRRVRLAVTLYVPEGGDGSRGPWPAVLEALPYRKDDVTGHSRSEYRRLAEAGYVVCRVDVRAPARARASRPTSTRPSSGPTWRR